MRAILLSAVTLLFASAGCGATRKAVAVPPEQFGVYRFEERLNPGYTLEGQFLVEGDTVIVDAAPGPCRYEQDRSNGMAIVYRCGTVVLSFDRADPIRKARYSAMVRMTESRSQCVRTVVNNGQQVCAQTVMQTSERDVQKTGTLRTERMEPTIGAPNSPATVTTNPPG